MKGKLTMKCKFQNIVSGGAATYSVNGRQYLAIAVGGAQRNGLNNYRAMVPDVDMPDGANAIFVFALPQN